MSVSLSSLAKKIFAHHYLIYEQGLDGGSGFNPEPKFTEQENGAAYAELVAARLLELDGKASFTGFVSVPTYRIATAGKQAGARSV